MLLPGAYRAARGPSHPLGPDRGAGATEKAPAQGAGRGAAPPSWGRPAGPSWGRVLGATLGLGTAGAGAVAPGPGGPAGPGMALVAGAPVSRPPAPAPLATPLLSPARLPRTLQDYWAQHNLTAALNRAMAPTALGRVAAAHSCAEAAQDGHVIYADHAGLAVLPASNMKLLTATALLDRLGPPTPLKLVFGASAPPTGGIVRGDLYLVGGGDPLLRLPGYARSIPDGGDVFTNVNHLVAALKAAGVHEVTGSVVGDGSRYDSVPSVPGWPATYAEEGDVGALSAVGIDDGFATAGPPVPDSAAPPVQSAGLLTKLLRAAGVEVDGPPQSGKAPAGAHVVAAVVSPPLGAELGEDPARK